MQSNSLIRLTIVLSLLCIVSTSVVATHFRYGHLSWKSRADLSNNTAEFTLFASFRRSGFSGSGSDGFAVTGDIIKEDIGGTSLSFGDGRSLGNPLNFLVIAYDPAGDWIYCKALADPNNIALPIVHTYTGAGPWTAGINDCCRISTLVNAPDANYIVSTTVNFSLEKSSPVSTLPTFVNCQSGKTCAFAIPAGDDDGDSLRWRLATFAESGISSQPVNLSVNANSGAVSWNTTGRSLGLYACQVIIEARNSNTGNLKSQVAVDFIINLTNSPSTGTAPIFDQPSSLVCGKTFDLVANKPFSLNVAAHDSDVGNIVTLNAVGLPSGATMTPKLPISGASVSSQLNWVPTDAQAGSYVVVFTATDNTGLQSQCSAVIVVRADSDGDGLPDEWEKSGYTYNGKFVNLPAMGANPNHKDIFIQVDYMEDSLHSHKPNAAALALIIQSFANAPVTNPDGVNGINLHITVTNKLSHLEMLGVYTPALDNNGNVKKDSKGNIIYNYDWHAFDNLKSGNFPEELSLSHHYCIFAHNYASTMSSGISRDIASSDFIVSLGSFTNQIGTISQQAGTLMHELGHNLGLCHGGPHKLANPDGQCDVNYKPNYLSLMNYSFQLGGLLRNNAVGVFDYSRFALPTLNEAHLNEQIGLNGGAAIDNYGTTWFCSTPTWTAKDNDPINWNCNFKSPSVADIEFDIAADINGDGLQTNLRSYNDWVNLEFKGGLIGAGIPLPLAAETVIDELDVDAAKLVLPPAPANFNAISNNGAVDLSWLALGAVDEYKYNIYRSTGNGAFAQISSTTGSTASDAQVIPGTTYSYYLTAINSLGTASLPSKIITITVGTSNAGYEGDVSPRPNGDGDGKVTLADWVQMGRFFIGADSLSNGNEFQRADSAPKASFGDGRITISDWVQAGRYAAGLDPIVVAGGPTAYVGPLQTAAGNNAKISTVEGARTLRAVNANFQRGQISSLQIELEAQGNENGVSFSLNFDPQILTFVDATAGNNNSGILQINSSRAASGLLGVALILPPNQSFSNGTKSLLTLHFLPSPGNGETVTIVSFGDQIVPREVADVNATSAANVSYLNSSIVISGKAAAIVSAASYTGGEMAAEMIVSAFGSQLSATTQAAATLPLPTSLGGTIVVVKDSQGIERFAPLFYTSPTQINFQIPAGTAEGIAAITIFSGNGTTSSGSTRIGKIAPSIFAADSTGQSYAAGSVLHIRNDGSRYENPIAKYDPIQNKFVAVPIDLSATDEQIFLILYGTGIRNRSDLSNVKVKIGGVEAQVDYAGAQKFYTGLDQLNVILPRSAKPGESKIDLIVDGKSANSVSIVCQ